MDDRTRRYLAGRFGDYYRQAPIDLPPDASAREWGYIPFSRGSTRMVRHRSILDIGDLRRLLAETAPQHVYFSAARYREPGADEMSQKGWTGADLIFDIDADHLPGIDPAETTPKAMLAAAKEAVQHLLLFIDDAFGFEQTQVVFSGGRGYHVHVRDAPVQTLDSTARREIVDYVRAVGISVDELTQTRSNQGTTQRVLRQQGGWGAALHERLQHFAAGLREMDRSEAIARLEAIDQIAPLAILSGFEFGPGFPAFLILRDKSRAVLDFLGAVFRVQFAHLAHLILGRVFDIGQFGQRLPDFRPAQF